MNWRISNQLLEIRYKNFFYFDRTGAFIEALLEQLPDFEPGGPSLERTAFESDALATKISFAPKAAFVSTTYFKANRKDAFVDSALTLFPALLKIFEIKIITRVGHRLQYLLEFDTEEKAKGYYRQLLEKKGLKVTSFLGSEDERLVNKKFSELQLRMEDEKIGIYITAKPGTFGIEIKGPGTTDLVDKLPPKSQVVVLDFDIYTLKPLPADQFITDALIKSNLKMVETRILPHF